MRQISTRTITAAVKDAAMRANFELGEDILQAFKKAGEYEESEAVNIQCHASRHLEIIL